MKIKIAICLFLTSIWLFTTGMPSNFQCRPKSGIYYLSGTVYNKKDMKPIRNVNILINQEIIQTDSNGKYLFVVHWKGECKKLITIFAKNINPKICMTYKNNTKKIKNVWQKYAKKSTILISELTEVHDIYF